jgi:glutamate dehydrogenase
VPAARIHTDDGFGAPVAVATPAQWRQQLAEQLADRDEAAAARFSAAVPAAYRDRVPPDQAARDLGQLERLLAAATAGPIDRPGEGRDGRVEGGARGDGDVAGRFGGAQRLTIAADPGSGPDSFRLRRYGLGPVELSSLLPVLESFGLAVVEAVPTLIPGGDGRPAVHIDDVGVRLDGLGPAAGLDVATDEDRLVEAIEAIACGAIEIDSLNRLVLAARLSWVQVRVLRAYRRYRRQAGSVLSDHELDDPLVAFPGVAAALVAYFEARLDPGGRGSEPGRSERGLVVEGLNAVVHRQQDQVLRDYLGLIDATVRTSYFLRTPSGRPGPTLTVKLDSRSVPDLPDPRPEIEAFVHGVDVEGIHLRFGRIARGGIRWSDRPDDFRTEILGLAEAQVKKNAIIVPTGAKGGFVCRGGAGAPAPADVRAAYETFIGALLDITDNLVDGRVVHPRGVVALDGDDPYLVVAADRGTASFSDLANSLAAEHGYWLGDAFASGGSHGYDHKAMGITARGAWVAVRRHFHQLGIDPQTEAIRVAGVGDMSGDVFGNGMLQSRAIELVAAFDHRHIFIDPTPDAGRSFDERRRLAGLGPSSWADYDATAISAGGGVWSRDAKSVPLSPPARAALGITAEEIDPPALISAILAAPVDLLWFGGIGTYIKAPDEADAEVGDHANDAVRVTADQVRARVIAEGGNLGVTDRARIRYSRRGGRINADFIDNAAGVATSDREVNLKILLALAVQQGRLAPGDRDGLLRAVEDHVAAEVLRQVDHSVGALNRAVTASPGELDAYEALVDRLEASGRIQRQVEALPSPEEWQRRREAGAGLIRPELAVLLAAAKSDLLDALVASDLAADTALRAAVEPYFAPQIRSRFGDLIPAHPLYRELLATDLAGEIIDQMGIGWAHELGAELDVTLAQVAGAFWTARQLLGADTLWSAGEEPDAVVPAASTEAGVTPAASADAGSDAAPALSADAGSDAVPALSADAEAALHRMVAGAVDGLTRRYILAGPGGAGARILADGPMAAEVAALEPAVADPQIRELQRLGVPAALARRVDAATRLVNLADVAAVARRSGRTAMAVLEIWEAVGQAAGLASLLQAVATAPTSNRWAIWLARGIVDDATSWVAATAGAVLVRPDTDLEAWLSAREPALKRVRDLLAHVAASPGSKLALAALAVRALPRDN